MKKQTKSFHRIFENRSEFSSYLLGFWMADGSIYLKQSRPGKYYKFFGIYNNDLQVMKQICSEFGREPYLRKTKKRGNEKDSYTMEFCSDPLFDFLFSITKTTHKSQESVPLPEIRDEEMARHFVRGFFDGDGSIFLRNFVNRHGNNRSSLVTSFTSGLLTGDFLERLQDLITKYVPIKPKKKVVGKSNQKLVYNQHSSMLLCGWMYKNEPSFFMERKKKVFDSFPASRLEDSEKFHRKS